MREQQRRRHDSKRWRHLARGRAVCHIIISVKSVCGKCAHFCCTYKRLIVFGFLWHVAYLLHSCNICCFAFECVFTYFSSMTSQKSRKQISHYLWACSLHAASWISLLQQYSYAIRLKIPYSSSPSIVTHHSHFVVDLKWGSEELKSHSQQALSLALQRQRHRHPHQHIDSSIHLSKRQRKSVWEKVLVCCVFFFQSMCSYKYKCLYLYLLCNPIFYVIRSFLNERYCKINIKRSKQYFEKRVYAIILPLFVQTVPSVPPMQSIMQLW